MRPASTQLLKFRLFFAAFVKTLVLFASAAFATWRWFALAAEERSLLSLAVCALLWLLWLLSTLFEWSVQRRKARAK